MLISVFLRFCLYILLVLFLTFIFTFLFILFYLFIYLFFHLHFIFSRLKSKGIDPFSQNGLIVKNLEMVSTDNLEYSEESKGTETV